MPVTLSPEATEFAWKQGRLKYKLEHRQKEAYDHLKRSPASEIFFLLCHRGFGKTFLGSVVGIESACKESEGSILIISGTLKKLRTVVRPAFEEILRDCPDEFRPTYHQQDSYYAFPSGVKVYLCAGESGHIESLRGIHKVLLVLIDEAAFFGDEDDSYPLDYVIEHILNPMFIRTKSQPRIVMMTTPPEVPNHPCKVYYERSETKGCVAVFDVTKSDVPVHKIEEQRKRCLDPLAWEREYLCRWVVDKNRLIIPEWDSMKYVYEIPKDQFFDYYHRYAALDTGVRDFTVAGIGYYDFKKAAMILLDEVVLKNEEVRTDTLAIRIKEKEKLHFGKPHQEWSSKLLYRRIGDNSNLIILQDLSGIHGLPFLPTTKDELFAMVNEVRLWVNAGRLLIHPRCKYSIGCLENGIWDKSKKEFGRSSTYGHYDAVAMLCYLIRNIDTNTNPIPKDFGYNIQTHHIPPGFTESDNHKALKEVFHVTKRKGTMEDWRANGWKKSA